MVMCEVLEDRRNADVEAIVAVIVTILTPLAKAIVKLVEEEQEDVEVVVPYKGHLHRTHRVSRVPSLMAVKLQTKILEQLHQNALTIATETLLVPGAVLISRVSQKLMLMQSVKSWVSQSTPCLRVLSA
jgi:hypothetical protein